MMRWNACQELDVGHRSCSRCSGGDVARMPDGLVRVSKLDHDDRWLEDRHLIRAGGRSGGGWRPIRAEFNGLRRPGLLPGGRERTWPKGRALLGDVREHVSRGVAAIRFGAW